MTVIETVATPTALLLTAVIEDCIKSYKHLMLNNLFQFQVPPVGVCDKNLTEIVPVPMSVMIPLKNPSRDDVDPA